MGNSPMGLPQIARCPFHGRRGEAKGLMDAARRSDSAYAGLGGTSDPGRVHGRA